MSPLAGLSQTLTISSQYGIPVATSLTEINQTGALALFDSNLGTLTGATLIIYGAAEFNFTGSNNSVQTQKCNITSSTELTFNSTLTALDTLIQNQNPAIYLSASSGLVTYASNETKFFGPFSKDSDFSYDLSSILSSIKTPGGGNFNLTAQSLSGLNVFGGGGNVSTTQTTMAGAGAKIIYSYTPVPEPSALFLSSIAGICLLLTRRR